MTSNAPWIAICGLALAVGCSRGKGGPTSSNNGSAAPGAAQAPGLGAVMSLVGHRFEMAGRAAMANRFELAEFEVGELQELFETDVPRAGLPKEGPTAQIPVLAKVFLETVPPELSKAAASKDRAVFATAFEHAAALCNACHQASAKAFIQVPAVPGHVVPDLDPLPDAVPASRPPRPPR